MTFSMSDMSESGKTEEAQKKERADSGLNEF